MFITLVICRDQDPVIIPGQEPPPQNPLKEFICPNKSFILGIVFAIFISMMLHRFYVRIVEKKKRNEKDHAKELQKQ